MTRSGRARLYIDDTFVGDVAVQRLGPSWSHGQFRPAPAFARFAPLFERWSLLMHAGGTYEHLSKAARDELREAEFQLDRLHARIHLLESDTWVDCSQLNVDGRLIEWKSA